jgi:hypothetical protein
LRFRRGGRPWSSRGSIFDTALLYHFGDEGHQFLVLAAARGHLIVERVLRQWVSGVFLLLLAFFVEILIFVLFVAQERLVSGGRGRATGWWFSIRGGS